MTRKKHASKTLSLEQLPQNSIQYFSLAVVLNMRTLMLILTLNTPVKIIYLHYLCLGVFAIATKGIVFCVFYDHSQQ